MPYRFFVVPFDAEAQVFQEGDFRAFVEKVEVREVKEWLNNNFSIYGGFFCSNTALKSLADALHRLRFSPCLESKAPQPKYGTYYSSIPKAAFFQQGSSAYWTAFVSYTGKAEQLTKPVHLNEKQLKIYEALYFHSQTTQAGRPLPKVVSRPY
jgi:hypothetical protein